MAPLHHHFQLLGWDETSVTMRFWLVQAVGSLLPFTSDLSNRLRSLYAQ